MRTITILACLIPLTACIPIPPHHVSSTRANLPTDLPAWLEPGRTTLADLLFRLGEPDQSTLGGQTLGWVSQDVLGGGILVLVGPVGGTAIAAEAVRQRRLVVQFDTDGVVTARSLESCTSHSVQTEHRSDDEDCLPPL